MMTETLRAEIATRNVIRAIVEVAELTIANTSVVGGGANALESTVEEGEAWSVRIVEALVAKGRALLG